MNRVVLLLAAAVAWSTAAGPIRSGEVPMPIDRSPVALVSASLDGPDLVTAVFSREVAPSSWGLVTPSGRRELAGTGGPAAGAPARRWSLRIGPVGPDELLEINRGLWRLDGGPAGTCPLWLGDIVDSPAFGCSGTMGLVRKGRAASMRIFAPTAGSVTLLLRAALSDPAVELPLQWRGRGVWEGAIPDVGRFRYCRVRVVKKGRVSEGIEPYSRSNTAHDGHGLLFVDPTPVADSPRFDNSENVVYELHLRDFTIDPRSGVSHKGKYLGLAEEGTRHVAHPGLATALDHLAELGVNTIHLMPVADFENDERSSVYNWGYMPVHFNSPDGWYATRTDGPERVAELKCLIDALHRKGMKVVLDVVYNHTAEGSPERAFGFNAMTDGYYYRRRPDGSYWNGAGCGNEFRTESRMGRKFVIDSLAYWAREYKVDGFRFDLMGLIDLETLEQAVRRLRRINPGIFVYGEPWAAGDTPIAKTEKGAQRSRGFSVFNDHFRDAIKGSVFDLSPGFVQGGPGRDGVVRGISGSIHDFADSPLETINYVSCHDNHTLWDRIVLSTRGHATQRQQREMAKLANAIVLTSQGIPFLHSGEEFLRTKRFEENSYDKPDEINRIDWELKWANRDVFEYYRDLLALRKAHPAFRMASAAAVRSHLRFHEALGLPVPPGCIAYRLDGAAVHDPWGSIVVLVNPSRRKVRFSLPPGRFAVAFDRSGSREGAKPVQEQYDAAPISLTILRGL